MNLDRPGIELFANLVFVWIGSNYFPIGEVEPSGKRTRILHALRVLVVLLVSWRISGWRDGWLLAISLGVAAAILLIGRERIAKRYLAEFELLNVCVVLGIGWLVARLSLVIHPIVQMPAPANVIPATLLIAAILCYSLRGGSYIVRGLLEKGALIPHKATATVDTEDIQVRHGRIIGYLERIVIIAAVAAGSFEALGFLIAAKGLIRAKEFDNRSFAEYFLVGSLCSVLVALAAGLLIKAIMRTVNPAGLANIFR
ncbi:MAG: hypothetical protein IAG10_24595 [Planctomycetaceae bacterium]|nr:hypothetical protein [Planctomycetaceae bacterium]